MEDDSAFIEELEQLQGRLMTPEERRVRAVLRWFVFYGISQPEDGESGESTCISVPSASGRFSRSGTTR